MGLSATIGRAVGSAFTALGDLVKTATYRRTSSSYDPATGANTVTNSDTSVSAVFTKFTELEIQRSTGMQVTDVKMTIQQSAITVTPSTQTDRVLYGGKTYAIVNFTPDPAGATFTLQLRAP